MTSDNNDNNIPGFAEIVNQLQGLVYNTVLGIVQNETDAEDVAHEVFIQIHESLAGGVVVYSKGFLIQPKQKNP